MFKTIPNFQTQNSLEASIQFEFVGHSQFLVEKSRRGRILRKLSAAQPYAGTADPPGYADLAAGECYAYPLVI